MCLILSCDTLPHQKPPCSVKLHTIGTYYMYLCTMSLCATYYMYLCTMVSVCYSLHVPVYHGPCVLLTTCTCVPWSLCATYYMYLCTMVPVCYLLHVPVYHGPCTCTCVPSDNHWTMTRLLLLLCQAHIEFHEPFCFHTIMVLHDGDVCVDACFLNLCGNL